MIQDDHVTTAFAQEHVNLRDEDEGRFRVFIAMTHGSFYVTRKGWRVLSDSATATAVDSWDRAWTVWKRRQEDAELAEPVFASAGRSIPTGDRR